MSFGINAAPFFHRGFHSPFKRPPFDSSPSFELLGSYSTGLSEFESSAETVAYHDGLMFITSAEAVALDIVVVGNGTKPKLKKRVDLSEYGGSINSVDVSRDGLVAVAVQGFDKTAPGKVVLLSTDGEVEKVVPVGALPDMVVFTHDGRTLLVANEGEPNCYAGENCSTPVDPNGSVTVISVVPFKRNPWWNPWGALVPRVRTVDFENVSLPFGVRVFGPNASPAQDLEPEYIAISDDDRTAYVTLQENNAIAVIDIARASVTEVRALGYKDFNAAPVVDVFEVANLPSIGVAGGNDIRLGGFSGLYFEGTTRSGKLKFVTHTDRGPNGEPTGVNRPFLLPNFTPELVRLELDPATGQVELTERIPLKDALGMPLTGLPNTAIAGANGNTPYNDEVPVDLFGNTLGLAPLGGDFEGVVVADDGSFWMADEYRPAIYHFAANGRLIDRFVPIGTAAAAGQPVGTYGTEALPAVLAQRRQNRGFEAIAMQGDKIYAFVQSPIRNPVGASNGTLNGLRNVRVVEFDPATRATRQFIYIMDNAPAIGSDDSRADKIGDAVAIGPDGFLVVERDDDAAPEDPVETISKKIYAFSLKGATDITTKDVLYDVGGVQMSLDQMSASQLSTVGVAPIAKVLHVDLASTAYNTVEKVEGLALIDADTIAVINDNDFGVAGIDIDFATGTYALQAGYVPEPVLLGIIETGGLDASDRDNVINIRNWPVYGMYQPDAIAFLKVDGQSYLITANEGDSRDYAGFSEEARAKDLKSLYPTNPAVADNLQLGRLTVTSAPPNGDLTQPYVFGTRSFSIWNAVTGEQVYDSGSELEVRTAAALPEYFNSTNDENNFDNRSDNKGPEPEGVTTGVIGRRTYAFVGLERIGGVMVYDVTTPSEPSFVQYLTNRDFSADAVGPDSGPEIVRFLSKEESPTGRPLLLVANEISGTVSLWSVSRR